VWASITLGSVIWTYRRQAIRYAGHATLLVYDRYVLDSAVHLRWRYGMEGRAGSILTKVLVWMAPTPLRSFYLQLPPDAAQRRKMEDRIEDLSEHARTYDMVLDGPAGADVVVLDASLTVEVLAAAIAESVWDGLEEREAKRRGLFRRLLRAD
jgi:thymidylate kinase